MRATLLLIAHPELIPFLEHAEPGDLSAVLPVRSPDGVLRGYRVLKLLSRDRPAPPPFSDGVLQKELTLRIQENLDRVREDAALSRLLRAAYVWPPEAFGREPDSSLPGDTSSP